MPAGLVPFLLLAACSGPTASPSVSTDLPASPSPSVGIGHQYSTTSFAIPLTVTVDPLLVSRPTADDPNILSWDADISGGNKVRFMIPIEVYPVGMAAPVARPPDFLRYLKGQSQAGAVFSDESAITVDGHAATLMTANTTVDMDGSLGCPHVGGDQADDCFGLQSDLSLRIAVIEIDGSTTLLAWARTAVDRPDAEFVAMFERMLASVRFKQP